MHRSLFFIVIATQGNLKPRANGRSIVGRQLPTLLDVTCYFRFSHPVSLRLRLITLTETLIIPDITKTESNNCFIIHCFEENNDKRIIAAITVYFQTLKNVQLSDKQIFTIFIKEIMHCARNLQIIQALSK